MRRYLILALIFISILSFFFWRRKAPTWNGQDLIVNVAVPPSFDLLFLGDAGTGDQQQDAIAQAMESFCQKHHALVGIVLLGDNFYPRGVSSLQDPQWLSKFQKPYGLPCLSEKTFYAILGNHDYMQDPAAQVAYHSDKPRWLMPHRFFEVRFGKALQLIALDSNVLDVCGLSSRCTLDFLWQALSHAGPRPSIVVAHHPLVSASAKYGKTLQGKLLSSILCHRASAYISGHSHHLEHRQEPGCELELFINGGGGADLYQLNDQDTAPAFAQSAHGFLHLRVSPAQLDYTFFDAQLQELYRYRTFPPQPKTAASSL